jgi:flagellar protein FlaG
MSVIPSGIDLSSTNIKPEYIKTADSENNVSLAKNIDNSTEKQRAVIQQEAVDKIADKAIDKQPLTPDQLEKVAQQLQDFVGEMNRGLEFSVDKDSGRDVIKVIDKASGDLVKQYPSEEVLTLVSKLSDMVGGFIDAKV